MTELLLEPIAYSKFVSHKVRVSEKLIQGKIHNHPN